MTYLYAIIDAPIEVADLRGLEGESLEVLQLSGVLVVVGAVASRPAVTRESLARQDEIVRALHARAAAVLPMRYGSAAETTADAARAVELLGTALGERLDRVRHRDQMTLRLTGAFSAPPPHSGAEYLQQRARPREIAPLLETLGPLVRATYVERGKTPGVMSVYHLIDRGRGEEYRRLAATAAGRLTALTVHVSGPSPCYAFT